MAFISFYASTLICLRCVRSFSVRLSPFSFLPELLLELLPPLPLKNYFLNHQRRRRRCLMSVVRQGVAVVEKKFNLHKKITNRYHVTSFMHRIIEIWLCSGEVKFTIDSLVRDYRLLKGDGGLMMKILLLDKPWHVEVEITAPRKARKLVDPLVRKGVFINTIRALWSFVIFSQSREKSRWCSNISIFLPLMSQKHNSFLRGFFAFLLSAFVGLCNDCIYFS